VGTQRLGGGRGEDSRSSRGWYDGGRGPYAKLGEWGEEGRGGEGKG